MSFVNFVSMRALDEDELEEHHTTTWFSFDDNHNIKSYDEFLELYNDQLHEINPNFINMLPIKITVNTNSFTSRSHEWLLNGCYKNVQRNTHHMDELCKYLEIIEILRHFNGTRCKHSYKHYHSRKFSTNTCKKTL